jgi:hypothetical protein
MDIQQGLFDLLSYQDKDKYLIKNFPYLNIQLMNINKKHKEETLLLSHFIQNVHGSAPQPFNFMLNKLLKLGGLDKLLLTIVHLFYLTVFDH